MITNAYFAARLSRLVLAAIGGLALSHPASAEAPSFTREIRPLLAAKCFACHGPDDEAREAELRLDVRESAVEALAIVPGKPDKSEMIARIESDDPDLRMPPPQAHEQLSAGEIKLIRRWIAAGAEYQPHWAFVRPRRPDVPAVAEAHAHWVRNEIDHFVLHTLIAEGLQPADQANRYTLIRRVYLDLIGLPPTPAEADAFINDDDPKAYEHLVDRLLDSPRYGEHWARSWLDLARYSDTNGYEKDRPRSIWPYRDWVIRALNDDMPYDQFTIEQLAGDMMPNATQAQRIATGFHRNTMLNEEGGIDPLEFRFHAMVDRVATTGTVWMGLTIGCAQCHSHKYDPITHTDYYRMMALLNNADEPDMQVREETTIARRDELTERIRQREDDLPNQFPGGREGFEASFEKWLAAQKKDAVDWKIIPPKSMATNLPRLEVLDDGSIFSTGDITKRDEFKLTFDIPADQTVTALQLEALPDDRLPAGGPGRCYYEGRKGDFFLSELSATVGGEAVAFHNASHTYGKIAVGSGSANAANVIDGEGSTGWSTADGEGEAHRLVLNLKEPISGPVELKVNMLFERHFAASLGRFRFAFANHKGDVKANSLETDLQIALANEGLPRGPLERLRRIYMNAAPELAEARKPIDALRKQMPAYPTTMVMAERPADNPRPTHRHHRGEYLSPREEVTPGVPALFPPLPEGEPANRLTFAKWLVSERNPLAARVEVNRAWRALFGAGLMRTSGDFGTQADPPTHPDLLDWLAREFVDRGWSRKELHRLIVTSATYRQSSRIEPELLKRDPSNRLLARGPRHRLTGETIRDCYLKASGLLADKMYGPSVRPPQPSGVTELAYGNPKWNASRGDDRYRRSLYTFSKRTAPFAAYLVFDGPTGENCVPRRDTSNTPLQSLTLLNDEAFLEFARAMARGSTAEGHDDQAVATDIFRRVLTRPPTDSEMKLMLEFAAAQRKRFDADELDAAEVAGKGATKELAVWTMLARVVMNVDEAVMKQ